MPIFEYKCKKCNHQFEFLMKSSDDESDLKCENCGSKRLEKLISAPSVSVKGGSTVTRCGKSSTCCGASTPCDTPSCGH